MSRNCVKGQDISHELYQSADSVDKRRASWTRQQQGGKSQARTGSLFALDRLCDEKGESSTFYLSFVAFPRSRSNLLLAPFTRVKFMLGVRRDL